MTKVAVAKEAFALRKVYNTITLGVLIYIHTYYNSVGELSPHRGKKTNRRELKKPWGDIVEEGHSSPLWREARALAKTSIPAETEPSPTASTGRRNGAKGGPEYDWLRFFIDLEEPEAKAQLLLDLAFDYVAKFGGPDGPKYVADVVSKYFNNHQGDHEAIKLLQADSSDTAGSERHGNNPSSGTPQNPSETAAPAGNPSESSEPVATPKPPRPPQNPNSAASDSPSYFESLPPQNIETPDDGYVDFGNLGGNYPPRHMALGNPGEKRTKRTWSQMIAGSRQEESTNQPGGDFRQGDLEADALKRVDAALGKAPVALRSYGILMRVRYCGLLLPGSPLHAQICQSQYTLLVRGHQ